MRKADVYMHGILCGYLQEEKERNYTFTYLKEYTGAPISLAMPTGREVYCFPGFPPFFDGLLPEGVQLESLLRLLKLDRHDYFSQLIAVGADMVGAVTVKESDK